MEIEMKCEFTKLRWKWRLDRNELPSYLAKPFTVLYVAYTALSQTAAERAVHAKLV